MIINRLVQAAKGEIECDLLLENARIVNVFNGEITSGSIAILDECIVGIGPRPARTVRDLKGAIVTPGLMDAHVHIESSMVSPYQYARAIAPRGATTVVADPHEIANVMGRGGISYMMESGKNQPVEFFFMLPSCVPATHMETSGASITAQDLEPLFDDPAVAGLAEMMNFPGVLFGDEQVQEKIFTAKRHKKRIDGHSPGLRGNDLQAYIGAGAGSDHECTDPDEALEKLEMGMHIMIREGTGAKNLDDLAPIITEKNSRRIMLCSDDRHPHDLLDRGHIDSMVARCIKSGLDPVTAIRMATLNTAEYFGFRDRGAIGPGLRADLVVLDSFDDFSIRDVYQGGSLVVEAGAIAPMPVDPQPVPCYSSMNLSPGELDLSIPASTGVARIIELIPNQILTGSTLEKVKQENGRSVSDTDADVLKIAVVERHHATGNVGLGFVKGFSLKKGAIASSVAHDSHNIIVVGINDEDMRAAVDQVAKMGGGLSATCGGKPIASCPLPIAGLMSDQPMEVVRDQLDRLTRASRELGSTHEDPFMILSFLALPVIPRLKLTDKGLVDVDKFEIINLFE